MIENYIFLALGCGIGILCYWLTHRNNLATLQANAGQLVKERNEFDDFRKKEEREWERARSLNRSILDHYNEVRCKNMAVLHLEKMLDRDEKLPHWLSTQLNLCFEENDKLPYPKEEV